MADESTQLRQFLKKEDIYDKDVEKILSDMGVKDPAADFKTMTQKDYDELYRRCVVERAKELKDQKAKVRLEKKMKKLEKFWRKQSGIKSTSIKKSKKSDAKPLENSAQAQNDALTQGKDLKKYLQKNQCFMTDLVIVCVGMGICSEADIEKIEDNSTFEEIFRQVRVARAKDLKDNASRIRMEKTVTKFEKLWRKKTGVEKTSIKKGKKGGKKKKKDPKSARNDDMAAGGATLKKWMRKENVWEIALYDELMANNINDPEALKEIDEETFDNIVRKVRVDRFSQLKDQNSRNRADKLLIKFEKIWRKASGNKKTSIK
eukprot:117500_1